MAKWTDNDPWIEGKQDECTTLFLQLFETPAGDPRRVELIRSIRKIEKTLTGYGVDWPCMVPGVK